MSGQAGQIRALKAIFNNSLQTYDELVSMRDDLKEGFKQVVKATNGLNPKMEAREVGAWRKVEAPTESELRPLVKSDLDQVLKAAETNDLQNILRKLDIL